MKRLFKDNYPYLYEEVHKSKNIGVDFSVIYENSGLKIWWRCKKNPKHIWQQSITNRTKKNYGCPYCYRTKTLPEDSFAALHPKLVSEVHPDKNQDFDPFKYRPGSNKKIWWRCANGHEWQQSIAHRAVRKSICKVCRRIKNSLATKYPEIAAEWHPTKNGDLNPEDVFISSKQKVWWRCKKDPSHEWEVAVNTRVFSKTRCPKCSKISNKTVKYPTIEVYSPSLAQQWHPTKNGAIKPSDYKPNSTTKIWWVCPINPTHEWQSTIRNRAILKRGCPFCANRVSPENSLLIRFPKMAEQWHPTKNGDLKPSDFSYGSSKKVWWQCTKDEKHEWQSTITARTQRNKIECPICAKDTYAVSNSLQSVHPEIAAQWHPTKNNSLKPNQVTRASRKKVWWQCIDNPDHEWKAQINNRTLLGAGCPTCSKEKNIIRLSEHLFDLVHSEIDYYHVFLNNISTLRKLLSEQDLKYSKRLKQPYYRMIYSSTITSLETYLSDAFYKKVSINNELLEKFIATNPEFAKRQYSLTEVIDWHKNLRKRVTDYLFNISWHNLPKIQNMYKDVLGVNFPEDISNLHKAVAIRHDIVHRNGRTKPGSIHQLDKSKLLNLISDVKDFVSYINRQLLMKTDPGASPDG
jgi:putative zinc ribbon protein/HEPN superfamily RiboL-PSP-like protein